MTQAFRRNTNTFGIIRRGILALAVCGSLAAGSVGVASRAEARVPDGPRVDSLSAGCGLLQDKADSLREQYDEIGRANPNDPRLDDILAQLRQIGSQWIDVCAGTFGNISYIVVARNPGFGTLTNAGTMQTPISPTGGSQTVHTGITKGSQSVR